MLPPAYESLLQLHTMQIPQRPHYHAGLKKIKEAFLPFWVVSADLSVQLHSARIGYDQWVTRWDPRTKSSRPELVTTWQRVTFQRAFWDQRYTSHDPGMQVLPQHVHLKKHVFLVDHTTALHLFADIVLVLK